MNMDTLIGIALLVGAVIACCVIVAADDTAWPPTYQTKRPAHQGTTGPTPAPFFPGIQPGHPRPAGTTIDQRLCRPAGHVVSQPTDS